MKKILLISLAVLMLSAVCFSAFPTKNDQTTITSDEQWWDWFNSLSDEEQACISFRPGSGAKAADESLPSETEVQRATTIQEEYR